MASFNLLEALSPLADSPSPAHYTSNIQTKYGLSLKADSDGNIAVSLISQDSQNVEHEGEDASDAKKYRYYIWDDYGTSFVCYDAYWPGNPQDDVVSQDALAARYGSAWSGALDEWVREYNGAFEAQECHLGSGKEPFASAARENAWLLRGILLASWLALQPDVDAVSYDTVRDRKYLLTKKDVGARISEFLQNLSSAA